MYLKKIKTSCNLERREYIVDINICLFFLLGKGPLRRDNACNYGGKLLCVVGLYQQPIENHNCLALIRLYLVHNIPVIPSPSPHSPLSFVPKSQSHSQVLNLNRTAAAAVWHFALPWTDQSASASGGGGSHAAAAPP